MHFVVSCDMYAQAITSKIELQGNITFHGNTVDGSFGGALYLVSSSQVILQDNTHVVFDNNNGRYARCLLWWDLVDTNVIRYQ